MLGSEIHVALFRGEAPMSQQDESKDLTRRRESEVVPSRPDTIQLGENQELDISGLTDEQKTALKVKHAEGALERDDRREER